MLSVAGSERKKSAKQLAAQARQEAEQAELSQSIREVYRKLAGYHGRYPRYPIDHAPAMDLSSDTRNQHFVPQVDRCCERQLSIYTHC